MKIDLLKLRVIASMLKNAHVIYIIGNGGSASLADHFACDLLKNCGLPAISLCSNQALITAIANDYGYKEVFSRQLKVLLRKEDVLIALSTRGESLNIIEAVRYCYTYLGYYRTIVGIAGFDGGELKNWSSIFYHIDSCNMRICENGMSELCHEISGMLHQNRQSK